MRLLPTGLAVLGFQRRERFRLLLKQEGDDLALLRFAPIARVQPMPAGGTCREFGCPGP